MEVIDIDSDSDENQPVDPILIKEMYSVTIKESDYRRLDPEVYLNDNLIDFFLNYILHKKSKTFHIFNSFFFPTYVEQGFDKVRKWFGRVDLFKKKYWVVPIAANDHWVLLIVTNPINVFINSKPNTTILLFDSMNFQDLNPKEEIQRFLIEEWKDKKNLDVMDIDLPLYMLKLPLQTNEWDCGVFILEYAKQFARFPKSFEVNCEDDIDFSDLFDPSELKDERFRLKNVILQAASGISDKNITDEVVLQFKLPPGALPINTKRIIKKPKRYEP